MRRAFLIATALTASLAVGFTAQGQSNPADSTLAKRECFLPSEVSGFSHAGRNSIYVNTGPGETYLFETMGLCPELDTSENLGFDHRGSTTICSGLDVTLIVPTSIGPQRCPIRMIRKLAPGEKAVRLKDPK